MNLNEKVKPIKETLEVTKIPSGMVEKGPKPNGKVKIIAKNELTGEVKVLHEDPNLIVNNFRKQESRLLAGLTQDSQGYDNRYIGNIAFGPNGDDTQVALNSEGAGAEIGYGFPDDVVRVPIVETNFPSNGVVEFVGTLGKTEANGKTFREVGLEFIFPEPFLAAREIFDPMVKSDIWSWEIHWTITLG